MGLTTFAVFLTIFALALQSHAVDGALSAFKNSRVYCNSEDRVSTRLLFFFDPANSTGQAMASLYVGAKVHQVRIHWEHTPQHHLLGKTSANHKVFELVFPEFGVEGTGSVETPTGPIQVQCTKM